MASIIDIFKQDLIARLSERTEYVGDCWLHKGSNRNGYANVMVCGRVIDVHRLSTSLYHGLDLDNSNEFANHKCSNRNCWNPEHLYAGTHQDNMKDKRNKPCRKCGGPREGLCISAGVRYKYCKACRRVNK